MRWVNRYTTFRPSRGDHALKDYAGQALTELALMSSVIVLMVLGIVVGAGAVGMKQTLQASVEQASRIGALTGNAGNSLTSCPMSASHDTVDQSIINAVLGTNGIDRASVRQIDIYKADSNGDPYYNHVDSYAPPFTTASPYNWSSCTRQSNEPADSLTVHVSYVYHPVVSLFGRTTIPIDDRSSQRLNPDKNANPCPAPGAPSVVTAHWSGVEPSATDIITWSAVPGASSYHIYANVDGAGLSTNPIITAASGATSYTYSGNTTFAPAQYEVRGVNYCGDGDPSLPAPNAQYALPVAPSAISATASITTPGQDFVSWAPVPDAQSYTITQTASSGGTQIGTPLVTTVSAPVTGTLIADSYTNPPATTVTYQVAATGLDTLRGPSAGISLTPATPLAPTTNLVGWWPFAELTGTFTADNASSHVHNGTLMSGVLRTTVTSSTLPFTNAVTFNGTTTSYITMTVSSSATNLPSTRAAQSVSWWMNPSSTSVTQTVIALTNPASASGVGLKLGLGGGNVGAWTYDNNALVTTAAAVGWHHYVFTLDGSSTYKLYVDNLLAAATSNMPNIWEPNASIAPNQLEFGRVSNTLGTGSEAFSGSLADVRIYTGALTSTEVAALQAQP